jgi:hypothetical protein
MYNFRAVAASAATPAMAADTAPAMMAVLSGAVEELGASGLKGGLGLGVGWGSPGGCVIPLGMPGTPAVGWGSDGGVTTGTTGGDRRMGVGLPGVIGVGFGVTGSSGGEEAMGKAGAHSWLMLA